MANTPITDGSVYPHAILENDLRYGRGSTTTERYLVDEVQRLALRGAVKTEAEFLAALRASIAASLKGGRSDPALRLAEVLPVREAVGTAPVVLLDDALSELDARARASVLREVDAAEQVFLTTPDTLSEVAGARFIVNQGGLAAA